MPRMNIVFEEPAWPDLDGRDVLHTRKPIAVTGLRDGMTSGKSSVALRIELNDGQVVIAETSLECFHAAAVALKARYGSG